MLANSFISKSSAGSLNKQVQKPDSFRKELIEFIAEELPAWRDRPDRKPAMAETVLTSQICAHLNSACRHAKGWDILQFRPEESDETQQGRKVDLVAAPAGCSIVIEGRSYVDFDSLLPIECKRLPTPKDKGRDEREYVFSQYSSAGGIQRFKAGHHGAKHNRGAMIGYVQDGTAAHWDREVTTWIDGLAGNGDWSADDRLKLEQSDATRRLTTLTSRHSRIHPLPDIELNHIWIELA
jgi:hypothetical protein